MNKNKIPAPPKEWYQNEYEKVKAGNPSYSDEQIRKSISDNWFDEVSKHLHEEEAPQKITKSLFTFSSMKKSQKESYKADTEVMSDNISVPVVVCEYFGKDGKFQEMRVVTAAEALEAPDKFDSRTFALLIRNLGKKLVYGYDLEEQIKCTEIICDLAEELEERFKEEKTAREKMKLEKPQDMIVEKGNWQLKNEYYMGKSIQELSQKELEDYFSDKE